MNVSVIGGGAWGITISQVLVDNGHDCMVYDVNKEFVKAINEGSHPFFPGVKIQGVKGCYLLQEAVIHADYIVICVPTKFTRDVLKEINSLIDKPKVFINVSKGIEPDTSKRVSEIVNEEIEPKLIKGYVALTGPSHAEELILRKLTLLVSASLDIDIAQDVQKLFSNSSYLRVYTSTDLIGCEIGSAIKNAIAVVSGMATGLELGENARAALISRGIIEIAKVVIAMGGNKETAYGLTGMGDLIVTASSENSRNFRAGKAIGQGGNVKDVVNNSTQTVEGVRTVLAAYNIGKHYHIELPIINVAYEVLYEGVPALDALKALLSRELKAE